MKSALAMALEPNCLSHFRKPTANTWVMIKCDPVAKSVCLIGFSSGNYMTAKQTAFEQADGLPSTAFGFHQKPEEIASYLIRWFVSLGIPMEEIPAVFQALSRALKQIGK